MSEVRSFFRHCPARGRRFYIKLVSKRLVDERKKTAELKQPLTSALSHGRYQSHPVFVEQDVPVTIDIEDFQFTYKCAHCGHAWSEMSTEEA